MQKVLDFLAANPVFQFATVDGDKARCRPFGFHMVENGKIYFTTGETKDVAKQLKANPNFELSTSNDKGAWLRLRGKAVFDTRPELVEKAFTMMPMLRDIYGKENSPKIALFYAADAEAILADMSGKSETIKL